MKSNRCAFTLLLLLLAIIACWCPAHVRCEEVKPGIDGDLSVLFNEKVGLVTNPTGLNSQLESTIDVLFAHPRINLTALFGMEHGIRGDLPPGKTYPSYVDPFTKLPVFSLYDGKTKAPTAAMLQNVTTIVFDVQDVGARCYTYITTLAECLKSAKQFSRKIVVFDRMNPVGGRVDEVQGPVLNLNFSSTVGVWKIPLRHGLTVGELAKLFNAEMGISASLTVVPITGWNSRLPATSYTRVAWVPPSPNLPTVDSALLYPGMVLFEATINVSLARGTPNPFFAIGAPYMDAFKLVKHVAAVIGDGQLHPYFEYVKMVPWFFIPTTSYHSGLQCQGLRLVILDNTKPIDPIAIALTLLRSVIDLYGTAQVQLSARWLNLLTGTDSVYNQLVAGASVSEMIQSWQHDLGDFKVRRVPYLIYK